jgi:tetratricopeptide (TPR) repeat protein
LTQQESDWCIDKGIAPDFQVSGCTAVIQSGNGSPNDLTSAHRNRGLAYYGKHDLDHAIADYTEAIRINPKHVDAYNNCGDIYQARQDLDRAIADFDAVIRLNPNFSAAFSNRCHAYVDKGDNDHAKADYDEAIRLNPTLAEGIQQLR